MQYCAYDYNIYRAQDSTQHLRESIYYILLYPFIDDGMSAQVKRLSVISLTLYFAKLDFSCLLTTLICPLQSSVHLCMYKARITMEFKQ